jgi:hypothetical protein
MADCSLYDTWQVWCQIFDLHVWIKVPYMFHFTMMGNLLQSVSHLHLFHYYISRNIAVKCHLQVMQVTDISFILSSKNVAPKCELQLYMGNLRLSHDYFYSDSSPAKLPLISYPFFPPPFYCALILVPCFLIFNHCFPCLPHSSMLKTKTMGWYLSTKLYDNPF